MTTTVWKFPLPVTADQVDVDMPRNAEPLHVDMQAGTGPWIWCRVDPRAPIEPRRFRLAGTGHELEANVERHLGTVQIHGGAFVVHVFDMGRRTTE